MQVYKTVKNSVKFQELEPKIGEELCKLWDADNSSQGGRTPRANNSTNRRGKPSIQSDLHHTSSQWQSSQPNLGYTAMQQVYTAHTPSLPIPVPIPSPRQTIPAHYPGHQVVTPQPMAVHTHSSVPFGAQAAVLQSQFHATAPRFTGGLHQTSNVRTMGPPPQGSRGLFHPSRK